MGSICSAINDDENDWYDFRKANGIDHLNWRLYSNEQGFAEEAKLKYPTLKGVYLQQFVELSIQQLAIVNASMKEDIEYNTYLELKKRFEP